MMVKSIVKKLQMQVELAKWINEAGLVHGYLRARSEVVRASNSFERIAFAAASLSTEKMALLD